MLSLYCHMPFLSILSCGNLQCSPRKQLTIKLFPVPLWNPAVAQCILYTTVSRGRTVWSHSEKGNGHALEVLILTMFLWRGTDDQPSLQFFSAVANHFSDNKIVAYLQISREKSSWIWGQVQSSTSRYKTSSIMKFFRLTMASAMENMIILVLTVFQHKLQKHVSAREQTNMEYTILFTVAYQYLTESDKSPTIIVSIYNTLKQTLSVKNKTQNKIWNTKVFSKPSTRIQLFVCTLHFFCESDIYYTCTYTYKYK